MRAALATIAALLIALAQSSPAQAQALPECGQTYAGLPLVRVEDIATSGTGTFAGSSYTWPGGSLTVVLWQSPSGGSARYRLERNGNAMTGTGSSADDIAGYPVRNYTLGAGTLRNLVYGDATPRSVRVCWYSAAIPPLPTPTPQPSPTPTDTATPQPSPTPTDTATPQPSPTPTDTATPQPSPTPTDTATPQPSPTPTDTATPQPSPTPTDTATPQPSPTPTDTATPQPSPTPTDTATPQPSPLPTLAPVDVAGAVAAQAQALVQRTAPDGDMFQLLMVLGAIFAGFSVLMIIKDLTSG